MGFYANVDERVEERGEKWAVSLQPSFKNFVREESGTCINDEISLANSLLYGWADSDL